MLNDPELKDVDDQTLFTANIPFDNLEDGELHDSLPFLLNDDLIDEDILASWLITLLERIGNDMCDEGFWCGLLSVCAQTVPVICA